MRGSAISASLVVAFTLGLALGCGGPPTDDRVLGGACEKNSDCAERCVEGGDFPDGMCTVDCRDDRDCPPEGACADKKGGVCMVLCERDSDCFPGYECRDVDREGAGGDVAVCIGD